MSNAMEQQIVTLTWDMRDPQKINRYENNIHEPIEFPVLETIDHFVNGFKVYSLEIECNIEDEIRALDFLKKRINWYRGKILAEAEYQASTIPNF